MDPVQKKISPVVITDYNPEWPLVFRKLSSVLGSALADVAHSIEHVGSTSVHGLAAKPIIDIIIVIPSMADFPAAARRLSSLGYRHNGDQDVPGREVFKLGSGTVMEQRLRGCVFAHHLYVCAEGCDPLERMLVFRDYLRDHPETLACYADLKKRLAHTYRNDRIGYTEGKTEFIRSVVETGMGF